LIHHNPQTGLQGKFSMEYCVARGLIDHQVRLEDFIDERVREPRATDLIRKTRLYVHPDCTSYDTEKAVVGVKLKGGGTLEQRVDLAKGHPDNPLSEAELLAKYEGCAGVVLSATRVRETAAMILDLACLADVRTLVKALSSG
jgi:2-methylcitrate dehydratase PrpD